MKTPTAPMERIERQCFDEERALYHREGLTVADCRFDGPTDGESALKECRNIQAARCFFNLRYPLWHVTGAVVDECEMTALCRAPLWYSRDIHIQNSRLYGVKALRECQDVSVENCDVVSTEFGWSVKDLHVFDSTVEGEYLFLRAQNVRAEGMALKGKYSFQYVQNATLTDCMLDTKDAFWHAENVTLKNCTLRGEYVAWYSKNLTLINCRIIGTQPFCYCTGLKLIDCEMINADFCFERSEVEATLTSPVESIRRPRAGTVTLPAVGEIFEDDEDAKGRIVCT